jgi:hypothetical protein
MNGINLIRDVRKVQVLHTPASPDQTEIPTKVSLNCLWKVVQYIDSKVVATYHTPFVYLKPMTIVLSKDKQSYWIKDAIVYKYEEYSDVRMPKSMVLYVGLKSKVEKEIDIESLKLCYQEKIETGKKTTRKRTVKNNETAEAVSDTTLS